MLDVKNEKGQVEAWSFEGPNPAFFKSRNVGKEDLREGNREERDDGGEPSQEIGR